MIYKSLIRAVVGEGVKRSKWRSMLVAVRALALLPAGLGLVHQQRDFMEPGFDFGKLDVVKEIQQKNKDCPYVMEKVTVFAYDWMDKNGKLVKDRIGITNVFEEETNNLVYSDGSQDQVVLRHRLSCQEQDDPMLVQTIKDKLLIPPPVHPQHQVSFHHHSGGLFNMLGQRYFRGKKRKGFFIELGSTLGETPLSKTFQFESDLHWSGLVIQPFPKLISAQNRKVWTVQTCLTTNTTPTTQNYSMDYLSLTPTLTQHPTTSPLIPMQCLPLYSLILAVDQPTVDLLVLSGPSPEYLHKVLRTIPWHLVDIRAVVVETGHVGEETRGDIFHLLKIHGYNYLDHVGGDDVFVKLDEGGSSDKPKDHEILSSSGVRDCEYHGSVEVEDLASYCRTQFPEHYFQPVSASTAPGSMYWVNKLLNTMKEVVVMVSWVASLTLNFLVEVCLPKSDIYRAVIIHAK